MARELIQSPRNAVWISAVSVWEIAIKHTLGREIMPISGKEALGYFRQAGYLFLAIQPEHGAAVEDLAAHHQDPFDRLLVAQALTEPMRLVTHDALASRSLQRHSHCDLRPAGFFFSGVLIRWRSPTCSPFSPILPVSGRGGRALNLGNKAAEDP